MTGAALLPEFDQEVKSTRRLLERVRDEDFTYRPHEKSMPLGRLAAHIANVFSWTRPTLELTEMNLAGPYELPQLDTADAVRAHFERMVTEARAALEGASAEDMRGIWTLRSGDEVYFAMPRAAVIRTFVLNHLYHHRGQLTVYLRECDVPVPGMYGPSADEGM